MKIRRVAGLALALSVGSADSAPAQGASDVAHPVATRGASVIEIVPPLPLHKAVLAFSTLPVDSKLPPGVSAAGVVPLPPQHLLSPWSIAAAPPPEPAKTARQANTALAALAAVVPLPRPRPVLPQGGLALASVSSRPADLDGLRGHLPAVAPGSNCRNVFALGYAVVKSMPSRRGPGVCGTGEAVELSAVVLADGSLVAIEPAATFNCRMAEAMARWVREDLAPSARRVGQPFKALKNFASYDCRGRNRNPFALMSEHGRANALDIRGFEGVDGRWRFVDSPDISKALLAEMRRGACERFMTVLGPGSDGVHENHIHVDLAERANGRKLCNWRMAEPMVAKAPMNTPAKPPNRTAGRTLVPVQP
ncbi:MAG: extensin family protein, partial [Methylacidiphilales bacterium]|nr:extensin family protein [Candidatus Methylacidiphilales bacterium]